MFSYRVCFMTQSCSGGDDSRRMSAAQDSQNQAAIDAELQARAFAALAAQGPVEVDRDAVVNNG